MLFRVFVDTEDKGLSSVVQCSANLKTKISTINYSRKNGNVSAVERKERKRNNQGSKQLMPMKWTQIS